MAKNTTKKTQKTTTLLQSACEQYVVNELIKTKQELASLKESLNIVKGQLDFLYGLIKKGTKAVTFDESGNTFRFMSIDGQLACTIHKDMSRENQQMKDFVDLIEYGKNM